MAAAAERFDTVNRPMGPPRSGATRWRYYFIRVVVRGVPAVWAAFSLVIGVGLVTVAVFVVNLSPVWIVAAVFCSVALVAAVGGYRVWSQLEATPSAPPSPLETAMAQIKRKLAEGYALQPQVRTDSLTGEHYRIHDDPVYIWALGTWKLLRTERPLQAKTFFGDGPYEASYFMVAYSAGADRGRGRYLDRRIKILEYVVSSDAATVAPYAHH